MSTNKKNTEEEVDLGSLFVIIGKGFTKLFNSIGIVLKKLFHLLILLLLFIRSHFIKFIIVAVIGGSIGAYFEAQNETTYFSQMTVKPSYESTRLLYKNIEYYNDLVQQGDTLMLSNVFKITPTEASSITEFSIEPIETSNDIIKKFNVFVLTIDSTAINNYTYKDYIKAFTKYDYIYHVIEVVSYDKYIFPKLSKELLRPLLEHDYYSMVNQLENENLSRTDSLLRYNLKQTDSIRKIYLQSLLESSKQTSQGTSIDFGNQEIKPREIELFNANKRLNDELSYIVHKRTLSPNVVNLISDFPKIGNEVRGLRENLIFSFTIYAIILLSLALLLFELNKYLMNYKK